MYCQKHARKRLNSINSGVGKTKLISNTCARVLSVPLFCVYYNLCIKSLVFLLPRCPSAFCSSVLKPNFNLTLRQAQSISQPSSFCCSQILCGIKCLLKFINLHSRECCSAFLFFLSIFGTFIIPWFASKRGGGDVWVGGYADETGGRSLSMGTFIANCRGDKRRKWLNIGF